MSDVALPTEYVLPKRGALGLHIGSRALAMSQFPTQEELQKVAAESNVESPFEPTGWWPGSRDRPRPWGDGKLGVRRKNSIPAEQGERWLRTKERVRSALLSTLGQSLDVAHDVLQMGEIVLRFAPIPGLAEAAHVLLNIWDAVQLVETNRLACLRLTERCADILLCVREEIFDAGEQVGEELAVPLKKLTQSFKGVYILLSKQKHRPFLKRYLKRDDILKSVAACDAALYDALGLFSMSIQIRTLRELQAAEAQRKADTDRLLAVLASHISQTDETPKQKNIALSPITPPPVYAVLGAVTNEATSSSPETQNGSKTNSMESKASTESNAYWTAGSNMPEPPQEKSPPPTPVSGTFAKDEHGPPSSESIMRQLTELAEKQYSYDHALDIADLRTLMREALSTSSDVEMLRVLQVKREEMPEALKTLQRALEQECEKDGAVQDMTIERVSDAPTTAPPLSLDAQSESRSEESSSLGLTGLRRRFTNEKIMKRKKTRDSRRPPTAPLTRGNSERDTLDREFMESGIDAMRRLSKGQYFILPTWTITRYEVDLEQTIGIGFFSDVYRAQWRNHTVAVKVLAKTTPKRLFLHEMEVWKGLQHPNVHALLGASSATGDPPWFFVSPYMMNGNLVEHLRRLPKPVESNVQRRMMYEIAKGMAYLHGEGVRHGDLKGTNVLINDHKHCVITDFGQSEMKSEVYRTSGTHPRGTLRWQAPEIFDGLSPGHLTTQYDVYSYAIVCVEIFQEGALPWSMINDETYRRLVLEENKRPPITSPNVSKDIMALIESCWKREPGMRPSFSKVVRELRNLGMSKYVDSPSLGDKRELQPTEIVRHSPDMRPLGSLSTGSDGSLVPSHPSQSSGVPSGTGSPGLLSPPSHHLSAIAIPMQRVITPIQEDDKGLESKHGSPVEYRPIKPRGLEHIKNQPDHLGMEKEKEHKRSKSVPVTPASETPSTASRSNTTDTFNTGTSKESNRGPGPEQEPDLIRFESPPPIDELIEQRRNERRYRLLLQHNFNPSLTLPLWDPSHVELGAVGYLLRHSGSFVTLFNAFDPPSTSGGTANGIANFSGYGKISEGSQRQGHRSLTQRGMDIIQGLMWFRSRTSGDFQQGVSRRVSFPIRARHKSAYLYVETTMYNYFADLDTPKRWFEGNIDRILSLYGKEHRLQKEDVFLVIGKLDAPNYGIFVNHNNPDGQVHFNVFSSPRQGSPWGAFSVDTDTVAGGGPTYHEEVTGKHMAANKVSVHMPQRPWETVLLARLRFPPDAPHPTSL